MAELNYKNAGVDIEAGYKSVEMIKGYVKEASRNNYYVNRL